VNGLRAFDDRLLLDANDIARHTGWLHPLVTAYASYGIVLFAVLLVSALVAARGARSRTLAAAAWAAVATLLAVGLNQPVGSAVGEGRPYAHFPHLLVLATRTSDFSFPSDHAVMAGAAATGLLIVSRTLGLVAAVLAVVMAVARVYIAAHYPWDVVAGLALGAAVAGLGWLLLRVPLTAMATWLRNRPGLRSFFADAPGITPAGPAGSAGFQGLVRR
jgi:membrane-associated phospholipid phosphatase